MTPLIKRSLQIGAFAALLAVAPVTFSADRGITEQSACAQSGTCCPETDALCIIGQHFARGYYFKSEGPCKQIE